MPEKYQEILTGSSAWLALFTAAGGCLVNYLSEYRRSGYFSLFSMAVDLTISCFLGYLTFWLLVDCGFTLSECAVGTCVVGNLGSRVFDIVRFNLRRRGIMAPEQEPKPNSALSDKDMPCK